MESRSFECCVLGAGPAGFGAALELCRHRVTDLLIIDRNKRVGGLARTELFGGARFDVGPHRFFTKSEEINRLWHDTLGTDFRPVDRLTRIYYKHKLFKYPLKAFDALIKLGPVESVQALGSFARAQLGKHADPSTFEEWITQKFGRKLYETFFKTYTEKIWGIPCSQVGAEWAAQRIKGLDVFEVLKNAVFTGLHKKPKTLVEQFDYPILGAGQMYEVMADQVVAQGAQIKLGTRVVAIHQQQNRVRSIEVLADNGEREEIFAEHFFSSIPLTKFIGMMDPVESDVIRQAAESLYYREHITVDLLVSGTDWFPDQWIYIHWPDVQMARLANYNNFSKAMVASPRMTALSVEYFVFQHDPLWHRSDPEIVAQAIDELEYVGLVKRNAVEQSWVVRETESYPTYYLGYAGPYETLKARLGQFTNLSPIGRGGMYKYNNQDHSIMSGLLAARNYLQLPGGPNNLWNINVDAEYQESSEREMP